MGMYDDNNGSGAQAWNNYYKFPSNFERYKLPKEDGLVTLDFLPFMIQDKNHPDVLAGTDAVGSMKFYLRYYTHAKVGSADKTYLCPKRSYGNGLRGGCPLCDLNQELFNEGRKQEARHFNASEKVLYNVIDPRDPKHAIKLFETSAYSFHEPLMLAASLQKQPGQICLPFADPMNGFTVQFYVAHKTKPIDDKAVSVAEFSNFSFIPRTPGAYAGVEKLTYPLELGLVYTSGSDLDAIRKGEEGTQTPAPAAAPVSYQPDPAAGLHPQIAPAQVAYQGAPVSGLNPQLAAQAPAQPIYQGAPVDGLHPQLAAQAPAPVQPAAYASPMASAPATPAVNAPAAAAQAPETPVCPYVAPSGAKGTFGIDYDAYKLCAGACPVADRCCLAQSVQRK